MLTNNQARIKTFQESIFGCDLFVSPHEWKMCDDNVKYNQIFILAECASVKLLKLPI